LDRLRLGGLLFTAPKPPNKPPIGALCVVLNTLVEVGAGAGALEFPNKLPVVVV
jgi:hypothetical protein